MSVDLALAKQHLRILSNDEDALILQYIDSARGWIETFTSKLLVRRQISHTADEFSGYLPLWHGPDVDGLSVEYTDSDGNVQTLADVQTVGDRAYYAGGWPERTQHTPIRLTYTAGYADVPGDLTAAWLAIVGHLFDNRDKAGLPMGVYSLCEPFRKVF